MSGRRYTAVLTLVLAACTGPAVQEGPTLRDLARNQDTEAQKVKAAPTPPPEPSPEVALDNYKRIADLATDPETKVEANRRLADLQIQLDEVAGGDADSEARQRDSIGRYRRLLEERPTDPNNDRVLYQLARAYQNLGQWPEAAAALGELVERYPTSRFAADAHFRRAELLFRSGQFADAVDEYARVIAQGPGTPFFEPAQYKYGWAQYKQGNYPQALEVFLGILERELPPGEATDAKKALEGVAQGKRDVASDALRVAGLSFGYMGGGEEINKYIERHGQPRFYPLLYNSLGDQFLERKRYSDAAKAFAAFQKRYPTHALAPSFQSRAIAAYDTGGFPELVVQEKERFVVAYDPGSSYWSGRTPDAEVMGQMRKHLDDVARFYHSRAQKLPAEQVDQKQADFLLASKWYRRMLDAFPRDPNAAEVNFLLAEALLESGKTLAAAQEYNRTATAYSSHPRASEAAYASVLAYQKYAGEVAPRDKTSALKQAISAGLKFAGSFPDHAQAPAVLVRASEDFYQLKDPGQSVRVAARALKYPNLPPDLQLTAWSVTADAQFALKEWPEAEAAYGQVLGRTAADAATRPKTVEQLSAAIYKQGEEARERNDLRKAVDHFLRVGRAAPDSSIRVTADYDAAAALMSLKDWSAATTVLEDFRRRYPTHKLLPDVDKKLALAYQSSNRPALAAVAFQRIAQRSGETLDTRQEAAWVAATLTERSGTDNLAAAEAYKAYLDQFPLPLDRAMDAREKLAQFAKARRDNARWEHWTRDIIAADATAGRNRTDRSRYLAAKATLDLARIEAVKASEMPLKLPLEKNLPRKKQVVELAIASLTKAADYGFADVTTAATYELGLLYQNFGRSLTTSDRPRGLSALELEQYNLLLEEEAFPFEEKAIEWHEANLKRAGQGVFDEWVSRSANALAQIAPGQYGKRERGEEIYRALR